jgi:hypothetical protein
VGLGRAHRGEELARSGLVRRGLVRVRVAQPAREAAPDQRLDLPVGVV